jgi:hypothetical protein
MVVREESDGLQGAAEQITPEELEMLSPLIGAMARLAMKRLAEDEAARSGTRVQEEGD